MICLELCFTIPNAAPLTRYYRSWESLNSILEFERSCCSTRFGELWIATLFGLFSWQGDGDAPSTSDLMTRQCPCILVLWLCWGVSACDRFQNLVRDMPPPLDEKACGNFLSPAMLACYHFLKLDSSMSGWAGSSWAGVVCHDCVFLESKPRIHLMCM